MCRSGSKGLPTEKPSTSAVGPSTEAETRTAEEGRELRGTIC